MTYHFGVYVFDARSGLLHRRGQEVRVQPKVMSLLAIRDARRSEGHVG